MVSKVAKIRLGVFIALGSLLILIFAIAVAGSRLMQKRDIYYIVFEDYSVSGLQVGGPVNYQGIKVGRIETIKIDPKNVSKIILTISVDAGTPIKADTEAVLTLIGITGLKAVEIRGGTNASALLKPNSYIKTGVSMMDDISDRAVSIAEKIDLIAANIYDMTSTENRKNIATILEQTSLLISDVRASMSTTLSSLSLIANNTAELTSGLSRNMDTLTNSFTKNLDAVSLSTITGIDSLSATSRASIELIAANLNSDLTTLTARIDQSLTQITEQSSALVAEARLNINRVGGHADEMVLESTKQIATIGANLNRSLDQVNVLLYSPEFIRLIANLTNLSGKLADTNLGGLIDELSVTIQKTGILVSTLNRVVVRGQGNLLDILDSLADTSENLNEFSRQISDTPSILLRGN